MKTGDLDLGILGKIGLKTCKMFVSDIQIYLFCNLTFTLELFIDQLKVSDEFDLDLDLDHQDQICHDNSNVCVLPCEYDSFSTIMNFTFTTEMCFDQPKVSDQFKDW